MRKILRRPLLRQHEPWWTAGGSNSRPPRCERGALPAELAAHQVSNPSILPLVTGFTDTSYSPAVPSVKKIGVLTGGGDAPGLNAVIRAVVKAACNAGIEVVGLEDSLDGLIEPGRSRPLTPRDVTGI